MNTTKPLLVIATLIFTAILYSNNVGAKETHRLAVKVYEQDLFDKTRNRPVKVTFWYPAAEECNTSHLCLNKAVRAEQVAVFSHGAMGAAKGYNWIGYALASQGFVVVGINHYGESWAYGQQQVDPSAAVRVWHRPMDISFALDELSVQQELFDEALNWQNITAIGHSSGGATVLSLVGAKWDLARSEEYCASVSLQQDKSCAYMQHKPKNLIPQIPLPATFVDQRVKRVIALDPALGHVTQKESLKSIQAPVLLITSKQNDFLDFTQHGQYYSQHIPAVTSVVLDKGEGHFVYLDQCKHKYRAMGVALCEDKHGIKRKDVQTALYPHLFRFINRQ